MSKYYSSSIQKGSKGDDVKTWQTYLNSQGYNLSVDGDFGDKTLAATKDYQTKNGLGVDGIVGDKTWGKAGYTNYSNLSTPTATPTIGPSPTNPTYDSTLWDDTVKGQAASGAYQDAKDAVSSQGPFQFSQNDWLEQVKQSIQGYGDFSYDVDQDALYQQLKDTYIQQGKLAMQDTMGQASAMTGGYGNSYAQTAGQQAYQSHLTELAGMVPELYQMALDRYNMGKDDLYNQYGLLMQEYEREYGLHSEEYQKLMDALGIARSDYYDGASQFQTEQANKNNLLAQQFNDEMALWEAATGQQWQQWQADETTRQAELDEYWRNKEWDYATSVGSGSSPSGSVPTGTDDGGNKTGATYADTLWGDAGYVDSNGNKVFINSEGKTKSLGEGINPYTHTKHPDAKHGTFSNGYQPDNIGGTKLKKAKKDGGVLTTNITGKDQTIWEANGKYWLWRGDLNKYIEVDISEI